MSTCAKMGNRDISFSLSLEKSIKAPYDDMYSLFSRTSKDLNTLSGESISNNETYIERVNVHGGVNKINSFYESLYENTVFEGVTNTGKDLSSPTIVSDNIANIEYLANNLDGKSAEILFHVNDTVYVNDSVKEIDFTIYDDISPEYSSGMAVVEFLFSQPGFYRELISRSGSLFRKKIDCPHINSLNIATVLLSYGESVDFVTKFFSENYGIDSQVKALKQYNPNSNKYLMFYSEEEFNSLTNWQKSVYERYVKDISSVAPNIASVASLCLLSFFLHCNSNNISTIKLFKFYSQKGDALHRNTVAKALPFHGVLEEESSELKSKGLGYEEDVNFQPFHEYDTYDSSSWYADFFSEKEYLSSRSEVAFVIQDSLDYSSGVWKSRLQSLVKGFAILYTMYRKHNPDKPNFIILDALLQ